MAAKTTNTTITAKVLLAAVPGALIALALTAGTSVGTPPCAANGAATTITERTYTGSGGPDIIQANEKDNVIYGRGGGDTICAYSGKDKVFGGDGEDVLYGEKDNDDLFGGGGADDLLGGSGRDECDGGPPTGAGPGADPDGASSCEKANGVRKG